MGLRALNNPAASFKDRFANTGTDAVTPYTAPTGMDASGGFISDYAHPDGNTYRCHIFTHSDEFIVNSVGNLPAVCDYVLVAGGGGAAGGGAGGGGGMRGGGFGKASGATTAKGKGKGKGKKGKKKKTEESLNRIIGKNIIKELNDIKKYS